MRFSIMRFSSVKLTQKTFYFYESQCCYLVPSGLIQKLSVGNDGCGTELQRIPGTANCAGP